MMVLMIVAAPVLFFLLRPKQANGMELRDLQNRKFCCQGRDHRRRSQTDATSLPALSDLLNNSRLLTLIMVGMG